MLVHLSVTADTRKLNCNAISMRTIGKLALHWRRRVCLTRTIKKHKVKTKRDKTDFLSLPLSCLADAKRALERAPSTSNIEINVKRVDSR